MTPADLAEVIERARRHARWLLRRERDAWSLEATALVNEAYLNAHEWLAAHDVTPTQARAVLARATRNALVNHMRRRNAQKRGGAWIRVSFDDQIVDESASILELLDVERALDLLEARDPEGVGLLTLRHYGGLTEQELAEQVGCSPSHVRKKLKWLHAWLRWRIGVGRGPDTT